MRHAAAGHDGSPHAHACNDARHGLTKCVTALDGRLRWQVGIDVNRQDWSVYAEMGERNAHRVIDLRDAGEGRVEPLTVQLPHEFEAEFARHFPAELSSSELTFGNIPDMDREGRRRLMKELLGMVVRKDDPQV